MTAVLSNIDKYQGVASHQVINAVQHAASRTGADFSFLMEKASTESSFDPSAKSKSSTATGLFQFIDSTWLNMVKQYGAKYGLGNLASQIQIKDGKPCVDNCAVKNQILNLRKNPEIAALMAGEYSAENKTYLEKHTEGDVGSTELYLAHFLGAGGAAKFINCLACEPDASAAKILPQAAHANKDVFYDKTTGQPRTLNQIYELFANKFDETTPGGASPSPLSAHTPPSSYADAGSAGAPASTLAPTPLGTGRQAPPLHHGEIIWSNDARYAAMFGDQNTPAQKISPMSILAMAEMKDAEPASGFGRRDMHGYNS